VIPYNLFQIFRFFGKAFLVTIERVLLIIHALITYTIFGGQPSLAAACVGSTNKAF
jgi:hypothetical protein